jgi:heat shock protein HtpX
MFIINPLAGGKGDSLFSTHPATHNRVEALLNMTGRGRIVAERGRGTAVPVTPSRRAGPWS